LQKDEKWVRKNAFNALGRLNGEKPIGLIQNAVCSRKERAGLRYCEWPIRSMGHVNVNSRVSIAAIEAALGRIVEIFKKARREPPYTAFETAVMSLVRIGPGPRALPLLEKALVHDDESVRWRSTFALRMLGGSRVAVLLEEALKNKKELNTFRWAVIDALVRIGGDKARDVLLANLSTPNKALNAHVAKQLKLNFWRDPRVAEALEKK
jgi:HEAT repeat protein